MNRYYCESCKTEINFGPDVLEYRYPKRKGVYPCPFCESELKEVKQWESPAEYEARTGKELSENAAVWIKGTDNKWIVMSYCQVAGLPILVANGPEPPSEN